MSSGEVGFRFRPNDNELVFGYLLDHEIPWLGLDSAAVNKLAICRIRKEEDPNSKKRKKAGKSPKAIVIDIDDDYSDEAESIDESEYPTSQDSSNHKRWKLDGSPEEQVEEVGDDDGEEVQVAPSFEAELERFWTEEEEFTWLSGFEDSEVVTRLWSPTLGEEAATGSSPVVTEVVASSFEAELERFWTEEEEEESMWTSGFEDFEAMTRLWSPTMEEEAATGSSSVVKEVGDKDEKVAASFDAQLERFWTEEEEESPWPSGFEDSEAMTRLWSPTVGEEAAGSPSVFSVVKEVGDNDENVAASFEAQLERFWTEEEESMWSSGFEDFEAMTLQWSPTVGEEAAGSPSVVSAPDAEICEFVSDCWFLVEELLAEY